MSNLNDEAEDTFSGVASGNQTDTISVNSSDNGESVVAFIDDGADGAPADFTIVLERYSERLDRWMEYSRVSQTGAGNPQSITSEAIPSRIRGSVVNDSAESADYRLTLVSY